MNDTNFLVLENDDPLDIRKDNVFKAVFTKETPESKGALSKLVSALIGKNVTIDSIWANEPPTYSKGERKIRYDINCRTEKGERINVEMSFEPKPYEPVRLEYYTGKLFGSQEISGIDKTYNDLKETYQIAILAQKSFFNDNDFFHSFEYYDHVRSVSLHGKTRIITLELSKVDRLKEKSADEMESSELWAYYFQNLTNRSKRAKINEILQVNEGIAMANEVLMEICRNEEERLRLLSEEKYIKDRQSEIAYEIQEERKKWQGVVANWQNVVADKDAKLADKDVEIARLHKLLENR
ncbi:MAG: Rpn family recombination-promoting nuclease/putative transposase [Treponema sp.]|jgi:predicted transposase/invertase (TIGR01784 family)|nr:Rpn family recombination-promoting nuclease/putative transposase [Treponema sp.]